MQIKAQKNMYVTKTKWCFICYLVKIYTVNYSTQMLKLILYLQILKNCHIIFI